VDVTDRAAFKIEASTHNGLLAKNLGGLSMIGPIIHPSPGNLPDPSITIEMTLNGEIVQSFSVGDLVVGFDQAMEAFSPMGYAAGDVIALGAMLADPSGDAAFQSPVTITPGDVIEVSADPIGKLTGAFTGRGR
ncbi:MAG: fumarylacetoacetate hydrolase family protein, partial [Rhodospirillales bacterium]|nr:fumarylacetoacetate hydrolase family protein [Rhodospirillales bacterium]